MRKWWVLIGTGIAIIMICIDYTIVFTSLSTLQNFFSSNLSETQWFMSGFGITFASFLTPMGRLADNWGRRKVLYIGMAGFVLSSIGAGLSQSAWQLILFRMLQGVFGAANYPSGIALVSAAFPKHQQGRALGLYGGILGLGLAIGPFLGGVILSIASWRWIFFINIPVVLIGFIICLFSVKESTAKEHMPIDWKAIIFLVFGLASLIYGITEGPLLGWGSFWVWGSFVVFGICLISFIACERKGKAPLLPMHLLATKGFVGGALVFCVTVSIAWTISFIAPLYLQNILDYPPLTTGLIFLIMTAMTAIGSPIGGYLLDKKGAVTILSIVFICLIISYTFQIFINTDGPLWMLIIAFIMFGFSWGSGNGIAIPLALSHLEEGEEAGTVAGALTNILNLLALIILAISTTIFQYGERIALSNRLQSQAFNLTEKQQQTVKELLSNPQLAKKMLHKAGEASDLMIGIFKGAFVAGYHSVIIFLFGLTLVIFALIAWALKPAPQDHSQQQK